MNCCIECFRDAFIRETIEKYGSNGHCDFCESGSGVVYDISDPDNIISKNIIDLLQMYSISDSAQAKPLIYALCEDWDIFNLDEDAVLALTNALCVAEYPENDDIFTKSVIISQLANSDFLHEFGVARGYNWDEFSESIKYSNRFHNDMFNPEQFTSILSMLRNTYNVGAIMYRARISEGAKGFPKGKMGAPPRDKRSAGRVNPEGIGALYLSSDEPTVLNEVRASAFDYITIGTFRAVRDINVVNLSGFGKTSPFLFSGELEKFAANRQVFKEIAAEIAKPLRRGDSPLEYLPTQFISEYIKSLNYDGVAFDSTLREGGANVAVFDESLFKCVKVRTVEVSKIKYRTRPELKK